MVNSIFCCSLSLSTAAHLLSRCRIGSVCSRDGETNHHSIHEVSKFEDAPSKSFPGRNKLSHWPQCDIRRARRCSQPEKRRSTMSNARRTKARHRVTDCISQFSQGIWMSQNQERWIGRITIGCQRENNRAHRLPQDATSLNIPVPKHRETACSPR